MRRALIEIKQRKLAILDDDYSPSILRPDVRPAAHQCHHRRAAVPAFQDQHQGQHAKINKVSLKSVDRLDAYLALLLEVVGPATVVSAIDYDLVLAARTTLSQVPKNRNKVYPGKKLIDQISAAKTDGQGECSFGDHAGRLSERMARNC